MIAATGRRGAEGSAITGGMLNTNMTKAADDALLSFPRDQHRRNAWDQKIDGELLEIARRPARFADDDLVPPSPAAIRAAVLMAYGLRDTEDMDPPRTIVPSGDGGIFFEWGKPGALYGSLEVKEDGSAMFSISRNCRIISRLPIA